MKTLAGLPTRSSTRDAGKCDDACTHQCIDPMTQKMPPAKKMNRQSMLLDMKDTTVSEPPALLSCQLGNSSNDLPCKQILPHDTIDATSMALDQRKKSCCSGRRHNCNSAGQSCVPPGEVQCCLPFTTTFHLPMVRQMHLERRSNDTTDAP